MDHKRISRVVRIEGELIHLYPRGDLRHGGATLATWGLAIAFALAALAGALSFVSGGAAILLIVAVTTSTCIGFIGVGIWRLASSSVTLDPHARADPPAAEGEDDAAPPTDQKPNRGVIRLPTGEITFQSVLAVHLSTKSRLAAAAGNEQTDSDERFFVDVVVRSGDEDEKHAALIEEIIQIASPRHEIETDSPDGYAQRVQYGMEMDELVERLSSVSVKIARQTDALSAWLTAETLARRLEVPLFDSCGERALLRLPHELDLPLMERLRQHEAPAHPKKAPRHMEAILDEAGLRTSWRVATPDVLLWVGSGLVMVTSWLLAQYISFRALPFLLVGATLLLASLALGAFGGRHRLRIDAKGLGFKRPGRRERKIPLAELEAVRVSTLLLPKTLLIADAELWTCRMPSAVAARWLSQAVERAIWTVKPESSDGGPYR